MRAITLILSWLLASPGVVASATAASSEMARAQQVGVEIVADDGSVFARYDISDGSGRGKLRAYLEAERGRNYGIRIHNGTGGRIGLVIAVDGRNIISGEKSFLRSNEPMYVLGAHQQAIYEGWRTSDTRVQRFFFTDAENSYAQAWGDRSAMGVIAVAAFREVPRVVPRRRLERRETAPQPSAPAESRSGKSAQSADAESAAGTGFGDSQNSRSVRVQFEPQRQAFAKQFLKYEWRETLVRLGIIPETPPVNRFWPEQLGQAQGFAPYPPGYWSRRHRP
ncbi:MAG: hypothetical protein BMS9Abin10_1095 [Gammaproteobacteria bacterium]|nr:MAG: hypothetical protein BMS9Abin10_1095 [Gammaproteobacteria bacterium]